MGTAVDTTVDTLVDLVDTTVDTLVDLVDTTVDTAVDTAAGTLNTQLQESLLPQPLQRLFQFGNHLLNLKQPGGG